MPTRRSGNSTGSSRRYAPWRGPAVCPRSEPSLFLLVTYAWGAAFIEQGADWPAWRSSGRIALTTIVLSLLVAMRQWKRSAFTSRAAGLPLMQLWFSIVGAWIVAASAIPGNGLGAL